jgi:hypothetical protein
MARCQTARVGWRSRAPRRHGDGVALIALLGIVANFVAACTEDSRTVSIFAADYREQTRDLGLSVSSCKADLEAEVVETAAEVEVTVTGTGGSSMLDCADGLEAQLDRPLDGRQVVDGSSGQAIEVVVDR